MSKAKSPADEAKTPAAVLAELGVANTKTGTALVVRDPDLADAEVKEEAPVVEKDPRAETNERLLAWPQDPSNMCQGLRREGARAIGRMNGDKSRMEMFMKTMQVLADYAAAKLEWQKIQKASIADTETRRKAAQAAALKAAQVREAANARKSANEAKRIADELEAGLEG